MRYAILAALLSICAFGMSAPVAADPVAPCVITVDVTGEANPSAANDSFYVDALVGGVSNYIYNVQVKINGFTMHSKNYAGSGSSIHRFIDASAWANYVNGNAIEYKVSISTVSDTFATTIGP